MKGETASSVAGLVKDGTVASAAEDMGTEMPGPELAAASAAEEETQVAAPGETKSKMWRVPQHQVDFILSWDVGPDVAPNLDSIDRLPFSEEQKEVYRAAELQAVAARNELRRVKRETQRWVRDLFDKHGEVVVDEKHRLDAHRARSKRNTSC
ncbi:hypothetical protein HU200_064443 [Digitaria exilis]|uniref:Uncharacterized protein n=1 Tax=Digitaria exilis TaxID=1010633 RepID=A0A835A3G6_9POAL|nr:hypothetical protein HU200_064443 [Digitaria exilis]